MRKLSDGNPVTAEYISRFVDEIGIDTYESEQFLRAVTERDGDDGIIGIVGLSLNKDWAHKFEVRGNSLRTWCAWDTLFIPLLLAETAVVESESPVSGDLIRVTVSPEGVKDTSPEAYFVDEIGIDTDEAEQFLRAVTSQTRFVATA